MRKFINLVALLTATGLAGGCGIKGPLYVPEYPAVQPQPPVQTAPDDHSNKDTDSSLPPS